MIEAVGTVAVLAALLWLAAAAMSIADPSGQLLRDLAELGGALFIAFSIAFAGAATLEKSSADWQLDWVGTACGFGISGLIAIGAALGIAAYREAGHSGALDIIGLCWIVSAIGLMGFLVAILPFAAYSWQKSG